jgi:hypothetical protein
LAATVTATRRAAAVHWPLPAVQDQHHHEQRRDRGDGQDDELLVVHAATSVGPTV